MVEEKISIKCYKCSQILEFEAGDKVSLHEECPSCETSIKCCKMCKYYDTSCYNECKEPIADRIVDKEKPNFCDFFYLLGHHTPTEDKEKLLDFANSLFKN